jgi:hypothetical protein
VKSATCRREKKPEEREEARVHDPEPSDDPGSGLAARQRPRPRHQRVGGVLAAEQEHRGDQAQSAKEPADRVAGGETVGDHRSHRREADRDHGVLDPLLEDGDAEVNPVQGEKEQPRPRER